MAESPDEKRGTAADLGRYTGLGLQLTASLALFGVAGGWLDRRLSTGPWLLILGLFLGAALGFYSLLRAVPSPGRDRKPPSGTE
jgi:F0F1-type ATP synthase assembly protein I